MDWNERYRTGDTPWDKGTATPVLDEMIARHPRIFSGKAIVPGCGIGHDARRLASSGCGVTGVDIAPLAIDQAKAAEHREAVRFEVDDFLNPAPHHHGAYDLLWEHTCLCALPPALRSRYFASAAKVLKSGGMVAGVFFIDPEMDEGESGPPFGISELELENGWRNEGFSVIHSWVPESAFGGRLGRERAMILVRSGSAEAK
jgi:methyl halide transferase